MIDRLGVCRPSVFWVFWRWLYWVGAQKARGLLIVSSGQLTVAGILLATIGGFGSLFAFLVSPDIRAYNRITGFLAFFALVAVGIALDRFHNSRTPRLAIGWNCYGGSRNGPRHLRSGQALQH